MNEKTIQAILQKLQVDKPILAVQQQGQHLTLHLLGGEIVQVDCADGSDDPAPESATEQALGAESPAAALPAKSARRKSVAASPAP